MEITVVIRLYFLLEVAHWVWFPKNHTQGFVQFMSLQVAQDGNCLLHSIRRALNCPKEYTSPHLRRQILVFLCDHAEFYMNNQSFIEALRGTYGWDGQSVSFIEYLEMMLSKESWADEVFLTVLSHMWAVTITIVYPSEGNREFRIRHDVPLDQVDFAILYTGQSHYSPIGEQYSLS